jgi:hypothetical protein
MDKLAILKEFSPADKLDQVQRQKIMNLEVAFKELAGEIADSVPDGVSKLSAIKSLLDAKFYCVHAISHAKQVKKEKGEIQNGKENI